LPGGVKRSENDVKDDGNFSPKKLNQSGLYKLAKDHTSNIDCLPGKYKNEEEFKKTRSMSTRKYETNDIFNMKQVKKELKQNKNPNKYKVKIDVVPRSNDFPWKGKSRNPDYIRNVMESQIKI
jgi:hypothetical protein